MRLRGGGPDMSDEESSSVVSDATSSVVSSASSSAFALPGESPAPAKTSTRGQAAAEAKSQTTTKVAAHDLSAQLSNLAVGKSEPSPKISKSSGARVDSSSVDTSLDSSHSSADVAPPSRKKIIATSDKSPTSVVGKDSGSIKKDAKTPQPSPSDRGEEDDGEFEMGAASSSVSGSDDPSSDDDGAEHSADSDESSSDTDMESSSTEDEDDDSSMQGDEGVRGEEDEDGVRQGRLVTQLRTNPAAMGLFFDLEVVGKEHIELTAFATASHITCRHPLDLEIFICEGGCDGGVDGQSDEPIWYSIFEQPNSTALPRMWECEPASPSEYGVLRLEQPLPLAPGERIGVCIRTSHPDGLVLRALQASTAEIAETRPGTGRALLFLGDKTDSDGNVALFAGRAMKAPLDPDSLPAVFELNATMTALVTQVQEVRDGEECQPNLAQAVVDRVNGVETEAAYAFAGMVLYSILKKT